MVYWHLSQADTRHKARHFQRLTVSLKFDSFCNLGSDSHAVFVPTSQFKANGGSFA